MTSSTSQESNLLVSCGHKCSKTPSWVTVISGEREEILMMIQEVVAVKKGQRLTILITATLCGGQRYAVLLFLLTTEYPSHAK